MPFVRIDTLGTDPARLDALGQAVQDALVQTPDIPPEDRFQVLTGHDGVTSTVRHGAPATLVETICRRWKIEEAFQRRRRSRHDPAYRDTRNHQTADPSRPADLPRTRTSPTDLRPAATHP
ncbi:hypothetical protein SHJG_2278 [Streptomyces hygroscopicus subsp. jinggangensis 5008]|nr:hypothetical protein SHJG_2278 [Streptomyces hygroscopicus subsp. jinggangensis 5008]AGF61709.1 hypothetical protein SHJGH_2043 [Streptomyces hygroscopicus subsp. jinggangensis TL01]